MDEISLGAYSLPLILSVFLGIVYKYWSTLADRYKSLIALGFGALLGILAMFYNAEAPYTIKMIVDYFLAGFMAGASAVGLYEAGRAIVKPRT
jgi:hypothetical protein